MDGLLHQNIMITGAHGFLGTWVTKAFRDHGCRNILRPSHDALDLLDMRKTREYLLRQQPDVVVHLAARVGGILANLEYPGEFFYQNALMGIQLLEACRSAAVSKVVLIGTVCSYPRSVPTPFREESLWSGYPEETNAPYGLAKKMLLVQGQAYRKQYGMNVVFLIPANLYGPGDDFDLQYSHVIPALVRRCVEAVRDGAHEITLWGSGRATREFLYVEDAAQGILLATERYHEAAPVNLGTGEDVSIAELAAAIAELTGFRGTFIWDASKPDGQPRRRLDIQKAAGLFGFEAVTSLRQGLAATISWYREHAVRQ